MKKKKMKNNHHIHFLSITLSQLFGMMLVNKTLFNSQFSKSEINEENYEDDFFPMHLKRNIKMWKFCLQLNVSNILKQSNEELKCEQSLNT